MNVSITDLKPLAEASFLPEIQFSLHQLFNSADSAVIKLAQEAEENTEQNRYFESVQGLRIVKQELINSFSECLLASFDSTIGGAISNAAPITTNHVDSEHINSLRNMMSVDIDAWRADASFVATLSDLNERFLAIDKNLKNPLIPDRFVDCFLHSVGNSDVDVYTKMLVIRMFEGLVYSKLERFVRTANGILIAEGVLPDFATQLKEQTNKPDSINALATDRLSHPVSDISTADNGLQLALADLQASDYEHLEETLSINNIQPRSANEPVRDLYAELKEHQLIAENINNNEKLQLEKLELVGKLFQIVLSDQTLPGEAKTLLAWLQLPFARIALADPAFLQESLHPAKVLLNEITRVCASWLPDRANLTNDVLLKKLMMTVQVFIESERLESIDYKGLLFEFLAIRELQRQKDMEAAQRFLNSQYGASATDNAREEVTRVLAEKTQTVVIPAAGLRILDEGWNNVLYICALQKGLASPEWKSTLAVVDELLETFQDPEKFVSRSEFLLKLPRLLKALRVGFTSIELPLMLIEELFLALEDEHIKQAVAIAGDFDDLAKVAAYQYQEPEPDFNLTFKKMTKETVEDSIESSSEKENLEAVIAAVIAAKKPDYEQVVQEQLIEEQVVEVTEQLVTEVEISIEENLPENTVQYSVQTLEKISRLGQGSSLLWNKPEGQQRCKIAAHIKPMKKYIITNRAGAKIADILEDEMAQKIECQEIETVDSDQIFDRALESVIGVIREQR